MRDGRGQPRRTLLVSVAVILTTVATMTLILREDHRPGHPFIWSWGAMLLLLGFLLGLLIPRRLHHPRHDFDERPQLAERTDGTGRGSARRHAPIGSERQPTPSRPRITNSPAGHPAPATVEAVAASTPPATARDPQGTAAARPPGGNPAGQGSGRGPRPSGGPSGGRYPGGAETDAPTPTRVTPRPDIYQRYRGASGYAGWAPQCVACGSFALVQHRRTRVGLSVGQTTDVPGTPQYLCSACGAGCAADRAGPWPNVVLDIRRRRHCEPGTDQHPRRPPR